MASEIQFDGNEYKPSKEEILDRRCRELINAVSRLKVIIEAIDLSDSQQKLVNMLVQEVNEKYHV